MRLTDSDDHHIPHYARHPFTLGCGSPSIFRIAKATFKKTYHKSSNVEKGHVQRIKSISGAGGYFTSDAQSSQPAAKNGRLQRVTQWPRFTVL